jgi:hypothetical protein
MSERRIEACPNNRLKLPVFGICIIVFGVLVIKGIHVALSAGFLALSVLAIAVVLSGRNPWWLRSPFDRKKAEN